MNPLVWSSLLLAVGLILVVLEVFIPSGGIMGFLSVSAVVAAIVLAFVYRGLEAGLIFLSVAAVGVPTMLVLAFRYWPKTPMGKRLLLEIPSGDDVLPESTQKESLRRLVGKLGNAKTVMLPSGAVVVGERTYDAFSQGMAIAAGERIKVVGVQGHSLVVRPASDEEAAEHSDVRSDDVLSRPIESLGLGGIDEPLT
jgi:membrane-bound ClpP family serine protease